MSSIRNILPYRSVSDEHMTKVQAHVAITDKRTVLSALGGDDGILTFVIQHAFLRTATFIRSNGLNLYDPANYDRLIQFVRDGSDPCAVRCAAPHADAGATPNREPTPPPTPRVAPTSRKSRERRDRIKIAAEKVRAVAAGEREENG